MSVLLGAMLVALLVTESAFQQPSLDGKVAVREWRMQRPDAQIWHVPNAKAVNHAPSPMGPSASHLTPKADNALQLPLSAKPSRSGSAVQPVYGQQPLPAASPLTALIKLQPTHSHPPAPSSHISTLSVCVVPSTPFTLRSAIQDRPDFNNFTPWACAPAAASPTQLAESSFSSLMIHDTRSCQINTPAASESQTVAAPTQDSSKSTALLPYHSFVFRLQLAAETISSHTPSGVHALVRRPPLIIYSVSPGMSTDVAIYHSYASRQRLTADFAPARMPSITPDIKKHSTGVFRIAPVFQNTQHMTLAALTQPIVTEAYITPQLDSRQASRKAPALLLATDLTRTAVHKPQSKQTLQSQSHQLLSLAVAPGWKVCLSMDALKQGTADLLSNPTRADEATEVPYAALIFSNTHHNVSGVLSVAMPEVVVAGEQIAALPTLFMVADCCAAALALGMLA